MAWHAIVRRVPSRSLTIVGDVAQTSSAAGADSWPAALDPVLRDGWRLSELTISYRTPAAVADAAQRMATAAGLPVSPLTAARDVPGALQVDRVDDPVAAAAARAADLAREHVAADGSGRVAIIAAQHAVGDLDERVAAALTDALGATEAARLAAQRPEDAQVVVTSPREAKGLEYDAVVLVEPADVASGPGRWGDLYVAMTRTTQQLVVLHARDLPDGLVDEG